MTWEKVSAELDRMLRETRERIEKTNELIARTNAWIEASKRYSEKQVILPGRKIA